MVYALQQKILICLKCLNAPRNGSSSKQLLGLNRATGPQGVNSLSSLSFQSVYTSQLRLIEARWLGGGQLTQGQYKNPEERGFLGYWAPRKGKGGRKITKEQKICVWWEWEEREKGEREKERSYPV